MILVLGKGLLGYTLHTLYNLQAIGREECDITDRHSVFTTFLKYKPEVVINCAGVVPKAQQSVLQMFQVNSYGPKLLELACDAFNARLIHISTDCVYSGKHPQRSEKDMPDPTEFYGMSKFLGEIYHKPHLTVRTSFVGLPDPKGRGLLAWASRQHKIKGFSKHYWNGLTTVELSRVLMENIIPSKMSGKLHVYGEILSKNDLLHHAAEIFDWDIEIEPVNEPVLDRTLSSIYPPLVTKDIVTMLKEMQNAYR